MYPIEFQVMWSKVKVKLLVFILSVVYSISGLFAWRLPPFDEYFKLLLQLQGQSVLIRLNKRVLTTDFIYGIHNGSSQSSWLNFDCYTSMYSAPAIDILILYVEML